MPDKIIDFDAWRAERREKAGETEAKPVLFRIGGKTYPLPAEPPATIVLDVIRLKRAEGSDASVPLAALERIGESMFGRETFRVILEENEIGAAGDGRPDPPGLWGLARSPHHG